MTSAPTPDTWDQLAAMTEDHPPITSAPDTSPEAVAELLAWAHDSLDDRTAGTIAQLAKERDEWKGLVQGSMREVVEHEVTLREAAEKERDEARALEANIDEVAKGFLRRAVQAEASADTATRQLAGYEEDWCALYEAIGLSRDETSAAVVADRIRELMAATRQLAEARAALRRLLSCGDVMAYPGSQFERDVIKARALLAGDGT